MTATLQEAEVLYSASDNIKSLAASGELKEMHDRVENLNVTAHQEYNLIREKLFNILRTTQNKEDDLYEEIMNEYPDVCLYKHQADEGKFLSIFCG